MVLCSVEKRFAAVRPSGARNVNQKGVLGIRGSNRYRQLLRVDATYPPLKLNLEGALARVPGNYWLAALAGLLLALAFPKCDIAGLAWVAPGLLLVSAIPRYQGRTFRTGFVGGLVYRLASLYWILLIPTAWPLKGVVILGWIALAAYCALYQGAWVWLVWRVFPMEKRNSNEGFGASVGVIASVVWPIRMLWCLFAAALWVGLEMVQARFLTGFPWDPLGVSQYQMLPLIQIVSITGIYGISFLLVWISTALVCSCAILLKSERRRSWMTDLFLPMLLIASLFAFGMHRAMQTPNAPRHLRAALVQPSIPQTMIWDPTEEQTRFQQVLEWSRKALSEQPKAELLVWPEAAVPGLFLWNTNKYGGKSVFEWITDLAREQQIWIIMGADDAEPFPDGRVNYYNSSFLVSPQGEVLAKYRKRRLVIFGEYVPFSHWLPFVSKMVGSEGEFTPGKEPVAFAMPSLHVVTSVLICFEDIFPHLARDYAQSDTDFLLNLTNNGWFGESAAQWQHAASAIFRAVENNLPLVRCSNNGLTCWVDRNGRMNNVYFDDSKNVYRAGYKVVEVPLRAEGKYEPTFYRKHGDLFGWSCCAAAGLVWLRHEWRRRRARRGISGAPA
jgi:apolipoprotein N-acyltransferase